MKFLKKIKSFIPGHIKSIQHNIQPPEKAYNIWAENYDNEQNNLMLYYDNIILTDLIYKINLKHKVILDYGCGTGRNWGNLLKFEPEKIIGCDISSQMIEILKSKFSNAETFIVNDEKLPFLGDDSVDFIISTLVIAHLRNIKNVFREWLRVLNSSSSIIITDFHPELLAGGGSRSFKYKNSSISIENFVHSIVEIENFFSLFGFRTVNLVEKKIGPDVKHFYEINNALHIYEKFLGFPFIYGILLSK
jgi:ubiquinone/menaquinone biosynthesis C-methylase UbiE